MDWIGSRLAVSRVPLPLCKNPSAEGRWPENTTGFQAENIPQSPSSKTGGPGGGAVEMTRCDFLGATMLDVHTVDEQNQGAPSVPDAHQPKKNPNGDERDMQLL